MCTFSLDLCNIVETVPTVTIGTTGESRGSDDDSEVIGIAVGASVGGVILIAIAIATIIIGLVIHRRRTFNKYAADAVYGKLKFNEFTLPNRHDYLKPRTAS